MKKMKNKTKRDMGGSRMGNGTDKMGNGINTSTVKYKPIPLYFFYVI